MMTPNVKKLREVCNESGSTQQLTPGLKLLDGTPILPGTALKGTRELKRTPPKIHDILRPTSTDDTSNCELHDDINAMSGDKAFWYVNIKTPVVHLPNEEKGLDLLDFALVRDGKFPTGRALERSPVRLSHEQFDGCVPESPLEVREVFIEPGSRIPRTPLHASSGRPSAACDLVIHYSRNRASGAGESQVSSENKENVKKAKPRKRSVSSNNLAPPSLDSSYLSVATDEANIFKPKKKLARTPIKQQQSNLSVAIESKPCAQSNGNIENNHIAACSPPTSTEIIEPSSLQEIETFEDGSNDRQVFKRSSKLSRTPVKTCGSTCEALPTDGDKLSIGNTEETSSNLEAVKDISGDTSIFQRSKKLSRTPVKGGDAPNTNLPHAPQIRIKNGGDASNVDRDRNSFNNQKIHMDRDTKDSNTNENPLPRKKVIQSPVNQNIAGHTLDDSSVTALVPLRPSVNSLKPPKNFIPKGKQLMRTPPSGKFPRQDGDGNSVAPSLSTVEECVTEDPTAIFMAQLRNNEPLPNRDVKKKPFLKSNKSKIVLNSNQLKKSKSCNKLDIPEPAKERNEPEIDSKKNKVPKSVASAIPKDRRLTYKVTDESVYSHDHTHPKSVTEKLPDASVNKSRKLTYVVQNENLTDMKTGNTISQPKNMDIIDRNKNCVVNTGSLEDSTMESDSSILCLDELCDNSLNFCDDLLEEAMKRKKSLNSKDPPTKTNVINTSYCLESPFKADPISSIGVSKIQVGDTPSQDKEPVNVMNSTFDVIANSDSDEDFFDAPEEIPNPSEQTEKLQDLSVHMNSTFEISKPSHKGANSTFDVEPNPSDNFSMHECSDEDETEAKNATFDVEPTQEAPEIRILNDTFDMDISNDTNNIQILNSTYDENSKLDEPHINIELDSPNKTLENTASTVIENITPNKTVEDENESSTKDTKSLEHNSAKASDLENSTGKISDSEDETRPKKNTRRDIITKPIAELEESSDQNTETYPASDKCDGMEDDICKPRKKSSRKTTKTKKAKALIVNSMEVLGEETTSKDGGSSPEIEPKVDKEMEELKDSESNEDNIKPTRSRRRRAMRLKSSDTENGDLVSDKIDGHKDDDIDELKGSNDEKMEAKNGKASAVSSDDNEGKKEEKPKQRKGRKLKKKPIKECSPVNIDDATDDENNVKHKEGDDQEESKSTSKQNADTSTTGENNSSENIGKENINNNKRKTKKKIDKTEEKNHNKPEPMEQLPVERPTRRQPRRNRKIVDYTEASSPFQTDSKSRSIVNNVDTEKSANEKEKDICGENRTLDPYILEGDEHEEESLWKANKEVQIYRDKEPSSVDEAENFLETSGKPELTTEVKIMDGEPTSDSTTIPTEKCENEQDMEIKSPKAVNDNPTKIYDTANKVPTESANIKTDTLNEQKVTRRKPSARSKLLSIRASFGLVRNTGVDNKPARIVTDSGEENGKVPDSNEKVVSDITAKLNEVSIEDKASKLAKPIKVGKSGNKPKATCTENSPLDDAKTTLRTVGRRVLSRCKKFTGSYAESSTVDEKKKRVSKSTSKEDVCSNKNTLELELGLNKLSPGVSLRTSPNLENVCNTESNVNVNNESESKNGDEIGQVSSVPCQESDNTDVEKSKKEKKIKRLSGIPMGLGNLKIRTDATKEESTVSKTNTRQEKKEKEKQTTKSKPTSTKTQPTKLDGLRKSFGFTANKPALRNSIVSSESSSRTSLPTERKTSSVIEDNSKKPASVAPVKSLGVRGVKQGKIAGVALKSSSENTTVSKVSAVKQKLKTSAKAAGKNAEKQLEKDDTAVAPVPKTKRTLKTEETNSKISANNGGEKATSLGERRKKVPVKKGVRNPSIESSTFSVSDSDFTESITSSKVQNPKPRKRQKQDNQIPTVVTEENVCAKTMDEHVPTVEVFPITDSAMEVDKEAFSTTTQEVMTDTSEYRNPEAYNEDEPVHSVNEKTKKVKRLSFIPICRGAVCKAKTTEDQSGKSKGLDEAVEGINTLQISSPIKTTRGVRKLGTTKPKKVDNQESTATAPEKKDAEPKKRGRKKKEESLEVTDAYVVPDIVEDKTESKPRKGRTSVEDQIHEIEQQLEGLNAQKHVSPKTDLQISRLEAKLVKLQDKLNASKMKQTATRSLRSTRLKKT